tara:strand:- start:232 stop:891 length:660 start_codon:yes stop_codon:yes gene_type:complete
MAPKGNDWEKAIKYWRKLPSDKGAVYDKEIILEAPTVEPQVSWGTSPQDVVGVSGKVPNPKKETNQARRSQITRSLKYMGLSSHKKITDIKIDYVFIGSCTNGRIEDLRLAAQVAKGKKVSKNTTAIIVPGSGLVKKQAEDEGLDEIFTKAGFEWREPGCSMCLAMNADKLKPGQRCASTSNRNFEGRQGRGGRTHLMNPQMAAAAAIAGQIIDVRKLL